MKRTALVCIALTVLLISASVGAVEQRTGNQVVIDTPINDDLIISGGTVAINACITGDVFCAGGTISINAPIKGDLLVAGGQIAVNADVEGKIIAAGGIIDLKGKMEKLIAAGGTVTIHSTALIQKYAFAAGGTISNAGEIREDFHVATERFQNTGKVGGTVKIEKPPSFAEEFRLGLGILSILWKIGLLILGLIFIREFGALFFTIEKEVRESTIKKTVLGFIFIIVAAVLILLLAITIVGSAIAAVLGTFFVVALMVAGLIVSYTLGDWILEKLKVKSGDLAAFILGFIILCVLFIIPYAGAVIRVVVVSLGFGAISYAVKNNWKTITAPKA